LTVGGLAPSTVAAQGAPNAAAVARPNDPWEKVNRVGFAIEGVLDRYTFAPLAHFFHALTPGPIGQGIHNVVTNLTEPVIGLNGLLQLRIKRGGAALVRFAFNTTFGIGGIFDVAGKGGIPHRANGFGNTLGHYGVGPGPYIYIPLAGPSTVRDLFGTLVDIVIDPVHLVNYPYRTQISISSSLVRGLDERVRVEGDLNALLSDAADPYATLRSTYLQNRQAEVEGGEALPALPALPDLDQPATPQAAISPSQSDRTSGSEDSLVALGLPDAGAPGMRPHDQPATFQALPDPKGGDADRQFARSLQ
jgi:phospholipid-binding lipoprotein MlaA